MKNVLFVVFDDLNAWIGDLGRSPDVKTPNLDAFARRGVSFHRAYANAPYCNSSRISCFSGSLPSRTGIYHNEPYWTMGDRPSTWLEALKDVGYRTFASGKVFHGVYDYRASIESGSAVANWLPFSDNASLWDEQVLPAPEPLPRARPLNGLFDFSAPNNVPPFYQLFDWGPIDDCESEKLPDQIAVDAARNFLGKKHEEPFVCAVGLYKPHLPWHAPSRFFDLYQRESIHLPLVRNDDLDDVPPMGRHFALNPPDHELVTERGVWREAVQAYLAAISYADWQFGRLIDAFDEAGLSETTHVVVCSDNGFHLGEKLHWRKFALWEEATRVPLIIVPAGETDLEQRVFEPVSLVDLFPTILDLAGMESAARDGHSLTPLFDPKYLEPDRHAIMTWQEGNHSLRWKSWRYTLYADGGEELYDHRADPYEWTNLAERSAYDEVRGLLRKRLHKALEG